MQADKITKENIHTLIMDFYAKILKDDLVAPIFIGKLGEDMTSEHWVIHLESIFNFWCKLALGERNYDGNLFLPHTQLGKLKRAHFERRLKLFAETLDEVYISAIAEKFKERSMIIAGNFMRNLQIK